MGGVFIITRLVTSSVRERFTNQLLESSRVSADGIVGVESAHLETLRLMSFTQGVAEAVSQNNVDALETLLYPLVLNQDIELLTVTNDNGTELMSLVKDPNTGQVATSDGADLSGLELVRLPLFNYADEIGDKFSALEQTIYGSYLLTSTPVYLNETEFVGVMVIGTNLQTMSAELKSQALGDVILLDPNGGLLATTFPLENIEDDLKLTTNELENLHISYSKSVSVSMREYEILYTPLMLRQRESGVLGVALPTNFIVSTEATSRNSIAMIFALATIGMIIVGYLLAMTISRPILKLKDVANAVAKGDLDQRAGLRRRDEIGDLASSFDIMIANLQDRTTELVQSEKLSAVGQLAAGIAHDVKNPLAVIQGLAEELQEDVASDPEIVAHLNVIRDNAHRADTIVSDLMTFARQSAFEMKNANIVDTVKGAVRLTDYLARKSSVFVEVDTSAEEIILPYAHQQIEQVLINLFQNAIQAMPNGGNLKATIEHDNKWVSIIVEDTGQGIPKENLQRIFDPFFTTKPEGEGTGLGLSVSYGIIKKHRGDIRVASTVGKGTTFIITLPLDRNQSDSGGNNNAR
jgi:signal transduction histidine kinase